MGRSPCCEKAHMNKGAWTKEEDQLLVDYIRKHGEGCWRSLPKAAGLHRCGKSCRLRWMNYLRPDLKRGNFTDGEDEIIIKLHGLFGNKWSLIAGRLPGRTDNEIKNYWNTHIKRKLISRGIDPQTHRPISDAAAENTTPSRPARVSIQSDAARSLDIDFARADQPMVKPESMIQEDGNFTSSGTTTEKEIRKEDDLELNLELSVGSAASHRIETSRLSNQDSAESTRRWDIAPTGTGVATGIVCLCCRLGLTESESCRDCQISSGFFRY